MPSATTRELQLYLIIKLREPLFLCETGMKNGLLSGDLEHIHYQDGSQHQLKNISGNLPGVAQFSCSYGGAVA